MTIKTFGDTQCNTKKNLERFLVALSLPLLIFSPLISLFFFFLPIIIIENSLPLLPFIFIYLPFCYFFSFLFPHVFLSLFKQIHNHFSYIEFFLFVNKRKNHYVLGFLYVVSLNMLINLS